MELQEAINKLKQYTKDNSESRIAEAINLVLAAFSNTSRELIYRTDLLKDRD